MGAFLMPLALSLTFWRSYSISLVLPPAFYGSLLTVGTLVLGYILPATEWIRDFRPVERAPAGCTKKRPPPPFWQWGPAHFTSLGRKCPVVRRQFCKVFIGFWCKLLHLLRFLGVAMIVQPISKIFRIILPAVCLRVVPEKRRGCLGFFRIEGCTCGRKALHAV